MELKEAVVLQKLGGNIRRLREKKGWTLRDMSERCGIDNSKISKIEKGTINITIMTLLQLSIALDTTPAQLLK
ncbi:helix-turn-helix domain-containing protein [Sediminibacterium ginsengisoli]|uniref:Helix-turn-helix domain-containing protein n=1 Tax=Sediminibacterium ginsengisoli TaxID=413434 RepID=A0A1T4KSH3_9BACT|nr:helix-turn-helix transcriptional regulator [Sediminibacterium ginsengisoli]SJZ45394.1 Helix-turn-helix domain-containing protein [Sediminibacterium ginsengisoli]